MENRNPCYKCEERQIKCHSTCEKYKEWRKAYDEQKAKIDKAREQYMQGRSIDIERQVKVHNKKIKEV